MCETRCDREEKCDFGEYSKYKCDYSENPKYKCDFSEKPKYNITVRLVLTAAAIHFDGASDTR